MGENEKNEQIITDVTQFPDKALEEHTDAKGDDE